MQNALLLIPRDLPAIGGMGRTHVDQLEGNFRHGVEGPNLGPEGRSSVAPKDERDKTLVPKGGEAGFLPVLPLPFPAAHFLCG